ncbi:MAG: peptidylprolyl isomerase [Caulobacteraceae bacterium]|nr:peptidylprolyl isomerase [Caulobacteraceae bacterium]
MTARARKAPWRAVLFAAALAGSGLALAACGDNEGAEKPPQAGDVAVATVDGRTVWTSDVKREAVAQGLIGQGEPLDASSEQFRQVLDQVIDQKLLAAEAVRRKLDREPVAQRRLAAARDRILGDMLIEGVVSEAVTENAIKALHAEQLRLARRSEEVRARQILVATEPEAQGILKQLAAGGSFEALAMERSTDAETRFNGGDLGYFTLDVMPEAIATPLQDAKPGDLVGPLQVEGGWSILKIEDRRPEPELTLEQARPQIVRFLTYDQVRDLIERLRAKAKVEMLAARPVNAPREPATAPKAAPPPKPAQVPPPAEPRAPPAGPAPPAQKAAAAPLPRPAPRPAVQQPRRQERPPARPAPEPKAKATPEREYAKPTQPTTPPVTVPPPKPVIIPPVETPK